MKFRAGLVTGIVSVTMGMAPLPSWTLTPHGLGPIKIGMMVGQVERALGARLKSDGASASDSCDQMTAGRKPSSSFLFEDGKLDSVTLFRPSPTRTDRGIAVGDREAKVLAIYGRRAVVKTRAYFDEPTRAHELTVKDSSGLGLNFLTNESGVIDGIRAGGASIGYMEGCL